MVEQDPHGDAPQPDTWWRRGGRLLRWLLGAATLVGGLTWVLLNLHVSTLLLDVTIGAVLVAGGLVLLMPHRITLPRPATAVVVTLAALAGTGAGLAADRRAWDRFAYVEDRGWPFEWAQRGAAAGDPDAARRLAQSADWTIDLVSLATDLVLWAYAGLLIVVCVVLARRRRDRAIRA